MRAFIDDAGSAFRHGKPSESANRCIKSTREQVNLVHPAYLAHNMKDYG